jgi:HEAT repeat protein/predicted MPP superfamily phosphohydrolase
MGKVPPNLGLVFRQFALSYYGKLKQDVPVTEESRDWCQLLLEQLAFRMTQGREKTQLQVAISKQEAEEILTAFLRGEGLEQPRNRALKWLKDLLKHHLIQLGANDQIEFRHQLIQEYYTAEYLLKVLTPSGRTSPPTPLLQGEGSNVHVPPFPRREGGLGGLGLSDDELKREFLNYLKWTEPLALMLELVEDEAQAVRVVKLALEVDLRLGAKLAGAVKPEFQEKTVDLIAELDIPQSRKIELLDFAHSDSAVSILCQAFKDEDSSIREKAISVLGKIGTKAAILALMEALKDEVSHVRRSATYTLVEIGTEATLTGLLRALKDLNFYVRRSAADALKEIGTEAAVGALLQALNDQDAYVCRSAIFALGRISTEAAVEALLQALNHQDAYICGSAVYALERIGTEAAVEALLQALNHQDGYVRGTAVSALGRIRISTEATVKGLLQALNDQDAYVRASAADALGKIGAEEAVPALLQALNDQDPGVCASVADALGKIGAEEAVPALLQALNNENSYIRRNAVDALGKIQKIYNPKFLLPPFQLQKLLKGSEKISSSVLLSEEMASLFMRAIVRGFIGFEERRLLYNPTLIKPTIQPISTQLMHILHLSDLHFGTLDQANLWSNQLAADLYNDLSIPHLDALILSGDIANYSTPEEYQAAEQFLHNLRQDFPLNPEQIILVPGNHDLNWKLAEEAYRLERRKNYKGELREGSYIDKGDIIEVRDEEDYKQRFAHFSQFYETIKQKPYPLDYDQQYTLDHLKEQNLLILGLNSAWQLDHHYKSRASIHMGALTNALTQIRRNPDYRNCLKIAVWHHPLDSAYSDRITDQGFLEQLAVNGFRFFLHGHIHKAETSLYRYDMSTNGRKLDRICAGTFGARPDELNYGYPWQYNLLKIEDNQLTVYTRRREELNGAWKPDGRWGQGAGKTSLDYYAIAL